LSGSQKAEGRSGEGGAAIFYHPSFTERFGANVERPTPNVEVIVGVSSIWGGKFEYRISKLEGNTKFEVGGEIRNGGGTGFGISGFELRICFGFRISAVSAGRLETGLTGWTGCRGELTRVNPPFTIDPSSTPGVELVADGLAVLGSHA
jgi:hypothetical protein